LYGYETWFHTIREHRLRVFENRVVRKIFGPRGRKWHENKKRLHNEELHNLYVSPNITRVNKSRRMRCAGHIARMGESRNSYNLKGSLLGRAGRRW